VARNPASSSKSPDAKAASKAAKADNRISVKYYSSVRSLSPGSAGGFFYWIAMRDWYYARSTDWIIRHETALLNTPAYVPPV
jgi:hypothetical protein